MSRRNFFKMFFFKHMCYFGIYVNFSVTLYFIMIPEFATKIQNFPWILLKRLTCHVFANNLVPEEQFGLCRVVPQLSKLLRLTEAISSGLDRKWTTVAVFLNINKTYDSTWHTGIVYKHIHIGLPSSQRVQS